MQTRRFLALASAVLGAVVAAPSCSDDSPSDEKAVCGNARIEGDEACDGAAIGAHTCEELGFGPGMLGCKPTCNDLDRAACGAPKTCGNGQKEGVEACDGEDLGGATCEDRGFGPGTLSCSANCGELVTSKCGAPASCGNGVKNEIEVCDGDDLGGATCEDFEKESGALACAMDCLSFDQAGCICKPECGEQKCGVDPKCGMPCGECDAFSACEANACVKVCDLPALDATQVLDIDVAVYTLTGKVTLNGGVMPNDAKQDGSARGELRLINVQTSDEVLISFGESGAVNYTAPILAGTYDVFVRSKPSAQQSVLPDDQEALIARGLLIDTSMTQNFDLKTVTLTGKVTLNGATMPDDLDNNGIERGFIRFVNVNTGDSVAVSLGEKGASAYSEVMFADTYDVRVLSSKYAYQKVLPDDQEALLIPALTVSASGAHDLDLKTVTLAGEVTLNGATMPDDLDNNGMDRATLRFVNTHTGAIIPVSLGEKGASTYSEVMFADTYDVRVLSSKYAYQKVLPDDQEVLLVPALEVSASGTKNLDLKTVTLTGEITLNGGVMPNDLDNNGMDRGVIRFVNVQTGSIIPVSLGETGPSKYSKAMFAATYDVRVLSSKYAYQKVLPDDQEALVIPALDVSASGPQNIDVKTLTLKGKVTMNGAEMPNDLATEGTGRGELRFVNVNTGDLIVAPLGETGPASYEQSMFADTYDIRVFGGKANVQTVLPTDLDAMLLKAVPLSTSMTKDLDLKVIELSGKVSMNGMPMPDDLKVNGQARGRLRFINAYTLHPALISLSETGPVTYKLKVFADAYHLNVDTGTAAEQTTLPPDDEGRLRTGCIKQ